MKVVEDFKRLPEVNIPRQLDCKNPTLFRKVEVVKEEDDILRINIAEFQSSVLRSYADVVWVAKIFADENPSLHVFRPLKNKYFLEGESLVVREENLCQLRFYLEYLFTYFYATNSSALINFFMMTYDAFLLFKKVK